MPVIDPEHGYLTVLNLFKTDTSGKRESLVTEMRKVVDTAAFPGWVSSTVHRGQDKLGTLNFIQWRGLEDLEARYAGELFKHRDMPVFLEIMTYARLMQCEVELSQRHPALGGVTEISPDRDDYTVAEILDVAPRNQDALVAAVGSAHEWLVETPGYRSQSVLRGIRGRRPEGVKGDLAATGADNSFVVVYSQWDSKASYDAYRNTPEDEQHAARRQTEIDRHALTISSDWNSYRVDYTRSAPQQAAA
ncbi:MAG TPA: antibiotic biosynthesis monooxygenase [Streptosporangiaceae bacterium]|nr:antibiotic biosynthesis monooxygenase [Streptosporangiaceae bacterium]